MVSFDRLRSLHLVFHFVLFFFLLGMWEEESRPNYKKWVSNRRLHMYFSSQPPRLPHRITLCIWKARRIIPKKQGSVNWISVWCCFHDCHNFSFHCSWDHFLLSFPDIGTCVNMFRVYQGQQHVLCGVTVTGIDKGRTVVMYQLVPSSYLWWKMFRLCWDKHFSSLIRLLSMQISTV